MKFQALPILQGSQAPALDVELSSREPLADSIPHLLSQHKAFILRSYEADWTVEDFGLFVSDCNLEYYPYIGGAAPRTIIPVKAGQDIIFTANER